MMILGRITADRRVDLPEAVLTALGLKPGDPVAFIIDGYGDVTIGRADNPFVGPAASQDASAADDGLSDPFVGNLSTFTEWADEHDRIYDQLGDR